MGENKFPTQLDHLNKTFLEELSYENGRTKVKTIGETNVELLGNRILTQVNVDNEVEIINKSVPEGANSFEELIKLYSDSYREGRKINNGLGSKCGKCEFNITAEANGDKLSGYHECWKEYGNFTPADFKKPLILSLWDFRKKDEFIKGGRYFLQDMSRDDLEPKSTKPSSGSPFLTRVDRQELQIQKLTRQDNHSHYIDVDGLKEEMNKWVYPLHFIDFETSTVAIPFNKGRRPYEQIAFQFSHHIVFDDGRIEHAGEWINTNQGEFPNFNFVRELKKQLENDDGTIFRYAPHENTILNAIYIQLKDSNELDKVQLSEWIKTITKSKSSSSEKWEGNRNMVDLLELVKKYYYHPQMVGSNSIKDVLPAILQESEYLQGKYSQSLYGNEILSHNYSNHAWILKDKDDLVINPYSLLPPINEGFENEKFDVLLLDEDGSIADGGAAMIAYAKMQFTEMSDNERAKIIKALLRYCELDTFAMVLIWEAWSQWCKQ